MSVAYSRAQLTTFRVVFGIYLSLHLVTLAPYAIELYSAEGMLPSARVNLTAGHFPNVLAWSDSPETISLLFVTAITSSLMIIIGRWPRSSALMLWYVIHCLYHRNNLTHHLGVNYVAWLLLVVAATPPPRLNERVSRWALPRALYVGGWMIFGLSYTVSGLDKLSNDHWVTGEALSYIARSPETSAGYPELILWLPDCALRLLTWGALTLEILALPMTIFKHTRRVIWAGLLGMHLGIMITMGFYDLTGGILCFYLLLMEPRLFNAVQMRFKRLSVTPLERAQRRGDAS